MSKKEDKKEAKKAKKGAKYTSVHYNSYLKLDELLSSQVLRSEEVGEPAHEEMLFIITHQVYELWFKQINHELRSVIDMFDDGVVNERNMGVTVSRLHRVGEILELMIKQIGILETMTPLDFLDFRSYLFPASGFQSFQFREMEGLLGLKNEQRHTYHNTDYKVVFDDDKKKELRGLEKSKSLFELVDDWLSRTPFLEVGEWDFIDAYRNAIEHMLAKEKAAIMATDILSDKYKKMRVDMLGDTDTYFGSIMSEDHHNDLLAKGEVKLSYKSTVAALLINLYRDEPILQMAFSLLAKLVDVDELLARWRYRHAQMVMRMIGKKVGTGGSSGHEYLHKTAKNHHIFSDLHNVSTLLIPRSELPTLPADLKQKLGFYYQG